MTTVRISGNWRNVHNMEWAGAPEIDADGRIERSIPIPEEAFVAIERQIAKGGLEGTAVLPTGTRFDWFLDGPLPKRTAKTPSPPADPRPAIDRLRVLLPEIDKLSRGEFDGSERQGEIIRLLALVVAELLRPAAGG
jgi:hypothetical protein